MGNEAADENRTVRRKAKDSVFTVLFQDVNNVYELYKELHPEDVDVTVDDIRVETLETVLINDIYNDLGFIVNSGGKVRYVILVEAQSRWTDNITLRMLLYITETLATLPIMTREEVTMLSRTPSMGGFVTWAKFCWK